jgi:UDPglucose--hexose-1-phosphate uridylyltransferase
VIFSRTLTKPDGRALHLYAAHAPVPALEAPGPADARPTASHLRWHPLRGEWVAYAAHRQQRTFLPPPEWNPLAPPTDPAHPTEVPAGAWDVAVFENLFPTLTLLADREAPPAVVPTAPGLGVCEVVVFTQDRQASLGALPLWHVELIVDVWAERTADLGSRPEVQYVMPFENRGVEVGVTLNHPHGQIYAYPFVPPVPARELAVQRAYFEAHHRGLLEDHVAAEVGDGRRLLWRGDGVAAFVPVCARYAYEVWIAPERPAPSLVALTPAERRAFARALKSVLLRLDGLWQRPMPYIMAFHQAPTDGGSHPEAHVHLEIYPYLRLPNRLKYLAGSEIAAGAFTADTLPEEKAAELRAVQVPDA